MEALHTTASIRPASVKDGGVAYHRLRRGPALAVGGLMTCIPSTSYRAAPENITSATQATLPIDCDTTTAELANQRVRTDPGKSCILSGTPIRRPLGDANAR